MTRWGGVDEAKAGLDAIRERLHAATPKIVSEGAEYVQREAQNNMGGPGPKVITGALKRSITLTEPTQSGKGWKAQVAPHVVYGRIQELGGTIVPKRARMLSWVGGDGVRRFARSVTLPPRPYLRPAVDSSQEAIQQIAVKRWGDAIRG